MIETSLEKVKKVRTPAPKKTPEAPLTIQEVKKKKENGSALTVQEKRLLKQEEKQQLGEVIEKKKRLKKEILIEDESNTYDNFNELADGIEEPVDIDNMTLEHIIGNKEFFPDPENEEERKLLERFGTTDPKIIDKMLQTDAYTEIVEDEDPSAIPAELLSPETGEEQYERLNQVPLHTENRTEKDTYGGNVWKRVKNWISRKNPEAHAPTVTFEDGNATQRNNWFEKFSHNEKRKDRDHQKINDFVEKQHALALEPDDFEEVAHDYQENLRKERRIVNPEDIAA